MSLIDLHSHVLPGVDDGAQDVEESLAALRALEAKGVELVAATPHFRASLLERAARAANRLALFDEAYDELSGAIAASDLSIEVVRGCEFKLDAPIADLADDRLRLMGTASVLVEFGSFQLPPFAGNQLRAVSDAGWQPLLAHPERYFGIESAFDRVARWVSEGARLQVNARSLSGGYGPGPRQVAAELLARGWVTCVASDYHARGATEWSAALELLRTARDPDAPDGSGPGRDAEEWVTELVFENPRRILADEPTRPVVPRLLDLKSGRARSRRRR